MCSPVLQDLTTPGDALPDMGPPLARMAEAADWKEAAVLGRIIPCQVRPKWGVSGSVAIYMSFL